MTLEKAVEAVASELERLRISTDKVGVILKTDTLGSLEALTESLRARDVPIRLADIGDISRREVMEALSVKHEEPLYGAILAFNVKPLPDAEREAHDQRIPIFMNDYVRWMEDEKEAKARKEFDALVKPGKFEIMDGFVFRRAKPAIFGVRVLSGSIAPNTQMVNLEGTKLGRVTQIQESGEAVSLAEEGKEVAVSMPQPIVGRHIKERDILFVDVPEKHAKLLREKYQGRLTASALEVLRELTELKRKKEVFWAV
jgi:translation initiation factor 5B